MKQIFAAQQRHLMGPRRRGKMFNGQYLIFRAGQRPDARETLGRRLN
jgi:hypothetical protein